MPRDSTLPAWPHPRKLLAKLGWPLKTAGSDLSRLCSDLARLWFLKLHRQLNSGDARTVAAAEASIAFACGSYMCWATWESVIVPVLRDMSIEEFPGSREEQEDVMQKDWPVAVQMCARIGLYTESVSHERAGSEVRH